MGYGIENREGFIPTWEEKKQLISGAVEKLGLAGSQIEFDPFLVEKAYIDFDLKVGELTSQAINDIGVAQENQIIYNQSGVIYGSHLISEPVYVHSPLKMHTHEVRLEVETESNQDELMEWSMAYTSRIVVEPNQDEEVQKTIELNNVDYVIGMLLMRKWCSSRENQVEPRAAVIRKHLALLNLIRRSGEGEDEKDFTKQEQQLLKSMCNTGSLSLKPSGRLR